MKKGVLLAILLVAMLSLSPCVRGYFGKFIRKPAVAGVFYSADKSELRREIDTFLRETVKRDVAGKLTALIVPHAGYIYSGPVAAYAYKQLEGQDFDTVILIGPSHRIGLAGVSVYNQGLYATPLGKVEVDIELANKIISEDKRIRFLPPAHMAEHSLEVQLPFLQRTLRDFKIVPIIISDPSRTNCRILADALLKNIRDRKVLIIASTDLSHYHPYRKARRLDKRSLDAIITLKPEEIAQKGNMCGLAAVLTTIMVTRELGANKATVLSYANSGDTAGSQGKVVGYGAVAVTQIGGQKMGDTYSKKEQEELLKIARDSIETFLTTGKPPKIETEDPKLSEKRGVFVTLRRGETLRGCIGFIEPIFPLYGAVSECAISAATKDIRFSPVTEEELPKITIEISVLSPTKRVKSIDEIEMGTHGVTVKKGTSQGVFLPQVAIETGWSKEEFLRRLCSGKAGLAPDAWKDASTEFYIFTVEKFEEEE
jgi:AmmeMemoRadiSam system protein B/AmmeMemoRadiSam system protein A